MSGERRSSSSRSPQRGADRSTSRPRSGGKGKRPTDDRGPVMGPIRPRYRAEKPRRATKGGVRPRRVEGDETPAKVDGLMRLNRYLAQSGVASRREADELIKAGVVTVNGKVVTELGTKVYPADKVHYGGQRLSREQPRYVLLNKPKDFLTTTDDPRERRTVMHLVESACPERLYPVGRLDRNTTGVLLLTNDGDLAKRLTHPSFGAEKLYHVTLDKSVTKADLDKLVEGVELEDGPAQADEASFVEGTSKREVGLKLHMGRNRVVRRMFEALGYDVVKLDRVMFAGLTKKDIPRGKWRHLSEKEVLFLTKRKKAQR
ncbi:MAG: rRNA pseudouridine synthase [Flavobacteriales bacterium]|nr:rRNA pseudouridine synthase [Flavobacteriales bacterium]